jgi:hypothetical protein
MEDIDAFVGGQEGYVRETGSGPLCIIHKYGLLGLDR